VKTLVIVSDTHGNRAAIDKLSGVLAESDFIIHLGDTSSDGSYIKKRFPDKTYLLNGNCDLVRLGERELVLQVESLKIFVCHGDAYGVKSGYDRLAYKAEQENCSIALFGHTHRATEIQVGSVTLFNPGTLSRYSRNTYLYLVINGDKAVGKIVELQ